MFTKWLFITEDQKIVTAKRFPSLAIMTNSPNTNGTTTLGSRKEFIMSALIFYIPITIIVLAVASAITDLFMW